MYDSIKFWLASDKAINADLLSEIPLLLSNHQEIYCRERDSMTITGYVDNMKVAVSEAGVSCTGSICKYYLGNNQETLSLPKVKDAVTKLADTLKLPIQQATLSRIDFSENFIMDYPVKAYYPFLGDAAYYRRLEQNNGVYYQLTNREMLFYDKVHEQKKTRKGIIDAFDGENVLRYEFRLKGKVAKTLNVPHVHVSDLYDASFYAKLLQLYYDEFSKIKIHNLASFDPSTMNSTKEFHDKLMIAGIESFGGEAEVLKLISRAKSQGVFHNKMQERRLKEKVKQMYIKPVLTHESKLGRELEDKIKTKVSNEIGSIEF